jgi:hypothetical protein
MLCTAVSSVVESNLISFAVGVVLTSVLFLRYMFKNRKKNTTAN